jgi:hypothetical protein
VVRIALTGPMYSGKTTLAEHMRDNHGWFRIGYNDIIKERLAYELSVLEGRVITVDDIIADKKKYRTALQKLGDALGFNEGNGVLLAMRRWERDRKSYNQPVIFDNVRFPGQFERLKEYGFVLVKLEVDTYACRDRATQVGVSTLEFASAVSHFAEAGVGLSPDLFINGDRPTAVIADILLRLTGKVRAPKQPATVKYVARQEWAA